MGIHKAVALSITLLHIAYIKLSKSQTCPGSCDCANPGIVTCTQKLTSFPVGFPAATTCITVEGLSTDPNQIALLGKVQLSNLQSLENLYITYSRLTTLEDDVFKNTRNIKRLYLKNNKISSISGKHFQNLPGLLVLDLTGNSKCKISTDSFQSLTKLQSLFLGDLQLGQVTSSMFIGLASIIELDLHGNDLNEIPEEFFKNMPSLRILDISGNSFVSLSESLQPSLSRLTNLDLSENPWTCLCDISWMRKLNISTMFSAINGNVPVCYLPYPLRYKAIFHISDTDFKCMPPKIFECGPHDVKLGEPLLITCKVQGHVFPDVTVVSPAGVEQLADDLSIDDPGYTRIQDVKLPTRPAEASDDGQWKVKAVNNKGKDESSFNVKVELPPTTTPEMKTSSTKVEAAPDSDTGFLIAVGGLSGTVLIGLIIFVTVLCCYKNKKKRVKPGQWDGKQVDEMTFVVAPVSG